MFKLPDQIHAENHSCVLSNKYVSELDTEDINAWTKLALYLFF